MGGIKGVNDKGYRGRGSEKGEKVGGKRRGGEGGSSRRRAQLKKYSESRILSRSNVPLAGTGGKMSASGTKLALDPVAVLAEFWNASVSLSSAPSSESAPSSHAGSCAKSLTRFTLAGLLKSGVRTSPSSRSRSWRMSSGFPAVTPGAPAVATRSTRVSPTWTRYLIPAGTLETGTSLPA